MNVKSLSNLWKRISSGRGRSRSILAILFLIALAFYEQVGPGQKRGQRGVPLAPVEGRARIIDGDSLRIGGQEVRMVGIDAPEGRQMCQRDGRDWPCGERAADRLRALAGNGQLRCAAEKKDQHGRLLATCYAGTINLNKTMVAEGWAVAYGSYRADERSARAAKRGIWAGSFEQPRVWRDKYMRR